MKLIQDTVQYERLIWKLRSYRINSDIISWVENFLLDRSQYYVETIGNNHSGSQSLVASLREVCLDLYYILFTSTICLNSHVNSTIYYVCCLNQNISGDQRKKRQNNLQKDFDSLKAWSDQRILKFYPK